MHTECRVEVAVVIVNYNSGLYLERCLRSLLRSNVGMEVCVVDNLSSDNSLPKARTLEDRFAESIHDLRFVENTENLGFSAAVNIGAASTTAPHLFVLNPDCYVHPHTARALRDALASAIDGGLIGALVFNEDGTEQSGCRRNEPTLNRSAIKALGLSRWFQGVDLQHEPLPGQTSLVDAVSGSAMLFCRRCFDEIGGMDERYFLHCEDLDVCHRMRDKGYGVYFAPGVSLFHRQGVSGGASNRIIESLKHQGMMRYYLQHYGGSNALAIMLVKSLVWTHFFIKQSIGFLQTLLPVKTVVISNHSGDSDALSDLPGPNDPDLLLVSGGNSDVGDFFIDRMLLKGRKCVVPFRRKAAGKSHSHVFWMSREYFEKAPVQDLPGFTQWVNLAPVWTSGEFASFFPRQFPSKIVALGSTSIEVKSGSSDTSEQSVVRLLEGGESALLSMANEKNAGCVILRPTLIYGGPRNKNINLIKKVIKLLRRFPVVGEAGGMRQPVHAEDVAAACDQVLLQNSLKTVYSIAGSEVLSFRQMVGRTFESLDIPPRFLTCPETLARKLIVLAGLVPGFKGISPGLIDRLQSDQVFSNADAIEDFGYTSRKFEP